MTGRGRPQGSGGRYVLSREQLDEHPRTPRPRCAAAVCDGYAVWLIVSASGKLELPLCPAHSDITIRRLDRGGAGYRIKALPE